MFSLFKKIGLLSLLFLLGSCATTRPLAQNIANNDIVYEVRMPEPHTHYFDVTMQVKNVASLAKNGKVQLKMAAWTPGSYLIREYAKNVEAFKATANGRELPSKKVAKNTWEISTNNAAAITVTYKVYAYELTVRTSFIDATHGYINGASVFLYTDEWKSKPSTLKIFPYEKWTTVSTALKEVDKFTYYVNDLDELIDSPIEIGNQELLTFKASGVNHTIANYSHEPLVYDKNKVLDAYKRVVDASTGIVGEHPCTDYLFIVHHLPGIGGGLEHLNSTTCQTSPQAYATDAAFKRFMGLIAHEYFHLWNVKRIRPIALGPFDYENENYTTMLWVSEGFTSFYQEEILRRAKLYTPEEFLAVIARNISSIENQPGQRVQSVAESSWDAWIKYYRPNENSNNSTISYYTKGGVLGFLLNTEILKATQGRKSMDDVFRYLWKTVYQGKNRGYTDEEFKQACELVAGRNFDSFFADYVHNTTPINYAQIFEGTGLEMVERNAAAAEPWFGARVSVNKIVQEVVRGSGAYEAGINVNDEILEVEGEKFTSQSQLTQKRIGDKVKVVVRRSGTNFTYLVPIKRNPAVSYEFRQVQNPTAAQLAIYNKIVQQ